jgi:hypothetical protein
METREIAVFEHAQKIDPGVPAPARSIVRGAEQIEHEVPDASRLAGEILEQVEDGSPVVIERDNLAVYDGPIRQAAQRTNNVRKSLVQGLFVA